MPLHSHRRRAIGAAFGCAWLLWSGHAAAQATTPEARVQHREEEFAAIAALLQLAEGSVVADVGAGGGDWSRRLAQRVGPSGRVFATEVKDTHVRALRSFMARRGFDQVTVVLGTQRNTNLPDGCCDAALLRLVYHAFDDSERMRVGLRRAIKPLGRLLVIDFRPDPDDLRAALEGSGFELVTLIPKWRGRSDLYAALFRRSPP